jgi:hypothetical protein
MKSPAQKITQASMIILISWLVVCGFVFAPLVCCGNLVDECIPASKKMISASTLPVPCKASPSHHFKGNPIPIKFSVSLSIDHGPGDTCCEADGCDRNTRITYLNPSSPQLPSLLSPDATTREIAPRENLPHVVEHGINPFRTVSIYLLKQSFTC